MGVARVVGVIPARLRSRRFPGKVLEPLCGRPLVAHAVDRLSSARSVEDVIVATDSPEVERAVRELGARVVLVTEPCPTGSDRVAAAVRGLRCDVVVNLQADQPLIHPADIDRTVEHLLGDGGLDITTLAYRAEDPEGYADPNVVKVVTDAAGYALYFSRAPIPASMAGAAPSASFLHHVGLYCFRRGALERFASLPRGALEVRESLEQLRALESGMRIGVVLTERASPGVDCRQDLEKIERELVAQSR